MALELKLNSSQSCDCKTLTLTDATGVYNVSTNPTGWGSPNTDFTAINCAYISMRLESGTTTYYKDITAIFQAATTIDDLVFTITMADLGGASTDSFTDGVYVSVYKVGTTTDVPSTGSCTKGTIASSIIYIPLYCVVQCCILSKIALIPQYYCCDQCNNDYVNYCMDLWMMLKSLQTANVQTSRVQFNNILGQVQKLCNNEDCECV